MGDIQAASVPLVCPVKLSAGQGRPGSVYLHSVASSGLGTLLGIEGAQACPENHHRFKCRTPDSALTSNSCLPSFWAPGWAGNTFRLQFSATFRLQFSAAQTNASYPKRLLWLGTRFMVRSWVDNQHCYFKARRTASSFMTTARSPFTFSRPLI